MSGTDRFFDCDCDDEIVGVLKGVAAAPHAPNAAFVQSVHTVEFDVEMPVDMQAMHGFGDSLPRSSSPSVQEPSFLASLAPAPSFSSPTSSQSRQMEPSSVHTDAHGDSMALPPLKLHTSVTTSVAGGNASAAVAQASSLTVAPCFGMAKPSAPIVPATNPLFSFEPRPQSEPLNNRVGRLTGTFRDNYFVWKPSATPTPSQAHPRAYDDDTATGSQPLQISSQQSVTMSQQSQISIVESSLVRSFSLPPSQSPQSQPSSSSSPVQMGSAVSASWNTSNVPFSWDLIDPAELQCPGPVPDNVALRKVDPMGVQSMRDFPECCLNTHEAFDPACGFSSFLNPMNVYVGARTSKAHDAGPVPDSFVKAHVMHFLVHIEEQGFTQRWELRASRVRAFTEGGETNGIIADQSAFRYARRPDVYCVQIKWASCAKNFHLQMELFFRGAGKTEMTLVLRSKPDLPFKVNSIASVVQKVYRRDQMSVSATNSPVKREHPPQRHYNSSGGTFRTDLEENDEEVALLTRSIPQTPVSATAGGFRTLTIATPSPSGSKRSRSQTDGRSQSAVGFLQSSYTSQMRSQTQVDVSHVPEQYEGHAFTSHDDVPELSPVQIDQVLVAEDAQPGSQPQLLVLHQRTVQPFTTPLVARKLGQSTPGYGLTPASETSTNLSLHDIPVDHLVFADEETFS